MRSRWISPQKPGLITRNRDRSVLLGCPTLSRQLLILVPLGEGWGGGLQAAATEALVGLVAEQRGEPVALLLRHQAVGERAHRLVAPQPHQRPDQGAEHRWGLHWGQGDFCSQHRPAVVWGKEWRNEKDGKDGKMRKIGKWRHLCDSITDDRWGLHWGQWNFCSQHRPAVVWGKEWRNERKIEKWRHLCDSITDQHRVGILFPAPASCRLKERMRKWEKDREVEKSMRFDHRSPPGFSLRALGLLF